MISAQPFSKPRVAVITSEWGNSSEEHFATRSTAAAIAYGGESIAFVLHPQQVTLNASINKPIHDGLFEVHHLDGGPFVDPKIHRALIEALTRSSESYSLSPSIENNRKQVVVPGHNPSLSHSTKLANNLLPSLQDQGFLSLYHRIKQFQPTTILIAGIHLSYLFRLDTTVRNSKPSSILLPLLHGNSFPEGIWYSSAFDHYDAIFTTTETERYLISTFKSSQVFNVGMSIAINSSAKNEPPPEIGGLGRSIPSSKHDGHAAYLLFILAETDSIQPNLSKSSDGGYSTIYASAHLPDLPIVAVAGERAFTLLYGKLVAERRFLGRMDLWRLMAHARATVDTRKDLLFDREVLESMSYGTPVVVNRSSIAYYHAKTSGGGLWYENLEELAKCIETLRNDDTVRSLGNKAQAYVADSYGSAENFIRRVQELSVPPLTQSVSDRYRRVGNSPLSL